MSSSSRNQSKGRPMNPKLSTKKDNKFASTAEDDDDEASNQTELAIDTTANVREAPNPQPTLANMLAAIGEMKDDMTTRFNTLDSKLHLVQTSLADHATRITDLEKSATNYETRITDLERRCEELMEANKVTKLKLIDLESRSRRSNIKITGLPENIEKGNPTQFTTEFLLQLLGSNSFPSGLKVDRAHRIGAQPSPARPRTMIAKIHHFSEKEKILQLARLHSPLSFNGARISIYPDFPPEISEQRRAYDRVKKKLREAGIKFGLLFPARLIFTYGNDRKIFQKPADAEAFIDRFVSPAVTAPDRSEPL